MAVAQPFGRLVRFANRAGEVYYGEVAPENLDTLVGSLVEVYGGELPWDHGFRKTGGMETIHEVLAPLPSVPTFIGVGLNYKAHVVETNMKSPEYPALFNKPSGCLAGPFEDIPVHRDAQSLDYEGELCVIIGKTCKNLSDGDDPLNYVLGYTAGNDISSRYWQLPERSGHQVGYAKGFDKFAPIGPVICSPDAVPDVGKLTLVTRVNGEERQKTGIDDLVFSVPDIIRFAARGHTLVPGTVIMTGTPSGVAAFMKPPVWLKEGDVVEIEIGGIGKIRNKMIFEE